MPQAHEYQQAQSFAKSWSGGRKTGEDAKLAVIPDTLWRLQQKHWSPCNMKHPWKWKPWDNWQCYPTAVSLDICKGKPELRAARRAEVNWGELSLQQLGTGSWGLTTPRISSRPLDSSILEVQTNRQNSKERVWPCYWCKEHSAMPTWFWHFGTLPKTLLCLNNLSASSHYPKLKQPAWS